MHEFDRTARHTDAEHTMDEVAANDAVPAPEVHRLRFTGSGREYFRIWIINLFLSVITLGIYSAWAKVRRLQYFDRNTQLAGASFDFDGDPKAILRGRVLALGLLGAYQYAFGFSLAVGIAVFVALFAALPFLMRGALRFRLANTRYRGLRCHFTGSTGGAYLAYMPPLAVFLLPALLLALDPAGKLFALMFLLYAGWPLMHAVMKIYQHQHIGFGSLHSSFNVQKRRFAIIYLKAVGLSLALSTLMMGVLFGGGVLIGATGVRMQPQYAVWLGFAVGALLFYLMYLLSAPYLQVRIGNLVWSATTFPHVTISSHMKARAYIKLQAGNVILTLLTLGLYRPFAVVRAYRYRIEHITVTTAGGLEHALATVGSKTDTSADGVADLIGLDLSW